MSAPKPKIDASDLEEGFTNGAPESLSFFLDLQTGKVVLVTEETSALCDEIWADLDLEGGLDLEQARSLLVARECPDWQIDLALDAVLVEHDFVERFESIPEQESRTGYGDMEAYIESLGASALAEQLARAIQGRGAFRRFKDVLLGHPLQREAWFAFERERLHARMVNWLDGLDIEYELRAGAQHDV